MTPPSMVGLNDSAVAAYYNLMVESATILGAERHEAESQMLDVLAFETQLANVSRTTSADNDLLFGTADAADEDKGR